MTLKPVFWTLAIPFLNFIPPDSTEWVKITSRECVGPMLGL